MKFVYPQLQEDHFPHFHDLHKDSNLLENSIANLCTLAECSTARLEHMQAIEMSDSGADAKATSLRWYHEAQPQYSQPPTSGTLNIFRKSYDMISPESLLYSYLCQASAHISPEESSGRSYKVPRNEVAGSSPTFWQRNLNHSRKQI